MYGYERLAELIDVPGKGINVLQNYQKFRILWHGRAEATAGPGTGVNVLQNSDEFFVWVWMSHRTHTSSGYG